jgi:hypothetical protein
LSDLRSHLHQIHSEFGRLTPELLVDVARDEGHPLHGRFEWDDSIAGERWRRHQAHELIQSVRVVWAPATESSGPKTVRAFHAVRSEDGHVYKPVEDVVQDDFTRQLVLADMEREWKQLLRRYEQFEEFLAMVRRDTEAA